MILGQWYPSHRIYENIYLVLFYIYRINHSRNHRLSKGGCPILSLGDFQVSAGSSPQQPGLTPELSYRRVGRELLRSPLAHIIPSFCDSALTVQIRKPRMWIILSCKPLWAFSFFAAFSAEGRKKNLLHGSWDSFHQLVASSVPCVMETFIPLLVAVKELQRKLLQSTETCCFHVLLPSR